MSDALRADFEALAAIGRRAEGGWSRPGYSAAETAAHDWLAGAARAAGLSVRQDAAGNTIARLGPADGPAIAIGSHLDTVEGGGAFDGALGVLAGLDLLRRRAAAPPPVALELIAFRDEEGRFGALTGSRAMTGALPPPDTLRDAAGTTLAAAMRAAGLDPDRIGEALRPPEALAAFLELHIEQATGLEDAGAPLGIVTAIAGQRRLSLRFAGQPDHAGTAPMHRRRDAFAAAARFADRFRDIVIREGGGRARGTIGLMQVSPNQGNVIPGEVRMALEIRDADEARLTALSSATLALAGTVAAAFGTEASARERHASAPIALDARLRAILARAAADAGHRALPLVSGANHDCGILAQRWPAALLFVPSAGGRSHCPEEHTPWRAITAALDTMDRALDALTLDPAP